MSNKNKTINPAELADRLAAQATETSKPAVSVEEKQPVSEVVKEPVETVVPEVVKPTTPPTINEVNLVKTVDATPAKEPVGKTESPSARVLQELIDRYMDYVETQKAVKPERCMELFKGILTYVLNNTNDKAVLDKTYSFFVKNQKRLADPTKALSGVYSITSTSSRNKVQAIYTLFCLATKENPGPIDWEKATQLFMGTELVSYIKTKVRNNAKK